MDGNVLFLCPHGAAKSILAKAFFNHIAGQHHLPFVADCAGTEPDEAVSPTVVRLLADEGIDVSNSVPRHVTLEDLHQAKRIISIGCSAQELGLDATQFDRWDDVPMVSQEPTLARDVIFTHVEKLIDELRDHAN